MKMIKLIRISVLCHVFTQGIHIHGPTVIYNFVNCINELVKINFITPGFLVFANTENSSSPVAKIRNDLLKQIHGSKKYVVLISLPDNKPICEESRSGKEEFWQIDPFDFSPEADYFLIVIDNYNDFTYLARKVIRKRFWNPHAKFIIAFYNFMKLEVNLRLIENVLSCLFRYNVINIIVVVQKFPHWRRTVVYSWKPYDPPKFCGHSNETAKNRLRVVNQCDNGNLKIKKDIIKNKIPQNMQGCILNILALERQPFISKDIYDPNIEKYLVNSVLRKFNFTIVYKIVTGFRGERNEKGVWNGALKKLVTRQGHILLGGIFPDFDVREDFECSSSYLADSYTWVVPRAYPLPPWMSLSITFHELVWYSAIAGFITCVFTWKILAYISRDSEYHKSWIHCFLNTWLCLLGLCAYIRPVKQSLRVFFVFLNLYCIIFLTAYQTKLIDVLQNPSFQDNLDTVEELVQSGLNFGGFEELHDLFYNSSDPFDRLLGDKWIDISNMTRALQEVVIYRNFSVLCSRLELAHLSAILPELSDRFGNNNFFTFPVNTFSVPLEMIALKGFPFMEEISRDLKLLKQLGVNAGVRRYFADLNMRKRAKLPLPLDKGKFYALSAQHLQGGFFALAIGVVGGTVILLFEIIYYSLRNRILKFVVSIRNIVYKNE